MEKIKRKSNPESKSLLYYYGFTKAEQKKYPVVTGILKQLTPEKIKKEIEEVKKVELPPELQKWVEGYEKMGKRNRFFWKWIYIAIQKTTLSAIEKKYEKYAWNAEFMLVMFIILIDDVVDRSKDSKLLNELLKIPFLDKHISYKNLNSGEKEHLNYAINVWRKMEDIVRMCPKYGEFEKVFKYDIAQIINALKYDYLINKQHFLINEIEYWRYSPNTMQIVAAMTLDLMCLPRFNKYELGAVREFVWKAQKMGRIANCLSTWEREVRENDFSSCVVAHALKLNVLSIDELKKENHAKIIRKIRMARIEKYLLKDWENYYSDILKSGKEIKSINLGQFIHGTTELYRMYLLLIRQV